MHNINLHFLKSFFIHYISATPIDVLHSPFVYNIYRHCIKRQKLKPAVFKKIEIYRKQLKSSQTTVNYIDFGAAANNYNTTVGAIVKKHAKPPRIAQIIYYLTNYLKPAKCIELGTSLGLTTAYFASALPKDAKLITIEACPDIYNNACNNLQYLALKNNVELQLGVFDDLYKPALIALNNFDCIFIDGNHTYEATLKYFSDALNHKHNNAYIIFDDIYWSKGMTRAWNEIINHPDVTASIDLFFIGIVFFRKEQKKQNFKLRIF